MTLCNLSAIQENQVAIVAANVIQPLIELSKSKDLDTQRYCGMCLCNLSAHPDNRRYMVTQVPQACHAPVTPVPSLPPPPPSDPRPAACKLP